MAKITISQLKQHINNSSKKNLSKEVVELFQKFSKVKEFYHSRIGGGDLDLREKYKKIIKNEFFPDRGNGKMRLSVARKAIMDFKKLCDNSHFIADIMIYYVEMGVDFTNEYGDITESFYDSMENMYKTAAKLVNKNNIAHDYRDRFKKMVDDTSNIGWGFHYCLGDIYYNYFQND